MCGKLILVPSLMLLLGPAASAQLYTTPVSTPSGASAGISVTSVPLMTGLIQPGSSSEGDLIDVGELFNEENCEDAPLVYLTHEKEGKEQVNERIIQLTNNIERHRHDSAAYNRRGVLWFVEANDALSAKADFEQAIELDPYNANAYYNLAVLYLRAPETATDATELIERESPSKDREDADQSDAASQIAELKKKAAGKAITKLNMAINCNPQHEDFYRQARFYLARGVANEWAGSERKDVIDDYVYARRLDPTLNCARTRRDTFIGKLTRVAQEKNQESGSAKKGQEDAGAQDGAKGVTPGSASGAPAQEPTNP
ncbi:tetratricopeptide repeat protein [Tautonia marina]|uniref:tetratricopeptide repeat protein n=1 Tax=Tautonia marina TaxID=2653855 RepID=UPI001260B951|nr:tetratricopeptide repeat protein [Tautonia marina]